jgi:ADP-ribosylglycohydrolase
MKHIWLYISQQDLYTEREQCLDEGKEIAPLQQEFDALDRPEVADDPKLQAQAEALLDKTLFLPIKPGHPFHEPSRLKEIFAARPAEVALSKKLPDEATLLDKAHGAWAGRCIGCLLGKGVEGRHSSQIRNYLQSQNRWPLTTWFSNQADEKVREENKFPAPDHGFYEENITCMIPDDDTNYTVSGLEIMKRSGIDFKPEDVLEFWMREIPMFQTCTAERIAYRNAGNGIQPVDSEGNFEGKYNTATFRNPYREWIGAQIRGDFFGYACPGNPARAAEFAWRDASISHIKNGIYGEMWVAAMLAAAYVCDDMETVIRAGLAQIPGKSRLTRDIHAVLAWRAEGRSYDEAIATFYEQWSEHNRHHWCHTNSNAQLVAIALLWGEMDLGKTLCASIMPGLDTDCNGATSGSVLGLMLGRKALPDQWTGPIRDTLKTNVQGYPEVKLKDLAAETLKMIRQVRA